MKKLMIVAAVAMAAFGLRAATANWTVEIAEFSADWVTPPVGSVVIALGGNDYEATFDEGGTATTTITGIESGTPFDVTMNLVLDDGKSYSKTLGYTMPIFDGSPADQTALAGLNMSIAEAFTDPDTGALPDAASAAAQGWAAAPEPTSGLLLLIGVAGLALRRRRA